MRKKYRVLSPDGFDISCITWTYSSKRTAREAFTKWAKGYEAQGYYRDGRMNKIALEDLADSCSLIEA